MPFHLPEPLHGWREFAGEVGIIVIGVLIALGAQQVVETISWHHQADDARAAIRAELTEDNLPQAYARIALSPCLFGELDRLDEAFEHHIERSRFAALADAYLPPLRTWDDEAWQAAISTGVLAHNGSKELIRWSLPYRLISPMSRDNIAERNDTIDLRSISHTSGHLTPAETDRVTVALRHLWIDAQAMQGRSKLLISAADEAGVTMSRNQMRAIIAQVRREWGGCVKAPVLNATYSSNSQR